MILGSPPRIMTMTRTASLTASLLAAATLAACATGPRPAPAPRPVAGPIVAAYFAGGSTRTGTVRIAEIPASQLTHLLYAFAAVSPEGEAVLTNACRDVGQCSEGARLPDHRRLGGNFAELRALKQRHPHLQTLISLGGWSLSSHFSSAAMTEHSRRRFVASTLDLFLRRWPGVFDGIDVDWEFPVAGGGTPGRPEDRRNFPLLLQEYRRQLDALGRKHGRPYLLTIATAAGPRHIANLELEPIRQAVDFINVMTYDYHTGGRLAHHNAPLYAAPDDPTPALNIHHTIQLYLQAGVPARQLVLGLPFYGRAYGEVPDSANGRFQSGDPSRTGDWGRGTAYRALVARQPEANGFRRVWDEGAKVPFLYHPQARLWISYDDPESIRLKAAYAREQNLGGVMFWELSQDDGSLLRALHEGLGR